MTNISPEHMSALRLLAAGAAIFMSDPSPKAVVGAAEALATTADFAAMSKRLRDKFLRDLGKLAKHQRGYRNMCRVRLKAADTVLRSYTPGVVDRDVDVGRFWIAAEGGMPIVIRLSSPLFRGILGQDGRVVFGGATPE